MWGLFDNPDIADTIADTLESNPSTDRRLFLKFAAATASTFMLPNTSEAKRRRGTPLDTQGLLYDIQLDTVGSKVEAQRRSDELEQILVQTMTAGNGLGDAMPKSVYHVKEDGFYSIIWNTNALAETAEILLQPIGIHEISDNPKLRLRPFFYNQGKTAGRFANILLDDSLRNMVQEFTTAYGREVDPTVRALKKDYREKGWFKDTNYEPTHETNIVPIPARWLKQPLINGQVKGEDYHAIRIEPNGSLGQVVTDYTVGNDAEIMRALRSINEIKKGQTLYVGDTILIPHEMFQDPTKPTVVGDAITAGKHDDDDQGRTVFEADIPKPKTDRARVSKKDRAEVTAVKRIKQPQVPRTVKLGRRNHRVTTETNMPAVLLEAFNLKNTGQVKHYLNKRNVEELAHAYARGVVSYRDSNVPYMSHVIIDPGHDLIYKGAYGVFGGKKYFETDFTYDMQAFMAEFLNQQGFKVHTLDYTRRGKAKARTNYFVAQANAIAKKYGKEENWFRECCYISLHADSIANKKAYLPRAFVPRGGQSYSSKLGEHVLTSAHLACNKQTKVIMLAQR